MVQGRSALAGRRILVVEDEYPAADTMVRRLEAEGAEVLGPVQTADRALDLIAEGQVIDAAVLDISLRESSVFPVADLLSRKDVPFVFLTERPAPEVPERFPDIPRCEKPFHVGVVAQALFG